MQIQEITIPTTEQQKSLDFITNHGLLETFHVIDSNEYCAKEISQKILGIMSYPAHISIANEYSIEPFLKYNGNAYYTGFEYIPKHISDELIQNDMSQYVNSFQEESENKAKYHKIYIVFNFEENDVVMSLMPKGFPDKDEIKKSIKAYKENDNIFIKVNSYQIFIRMVNKKFRSTQFQYSENNSAFEESDWTEHSMDIIESVISHELNHVARQFILTDKNLITQGKKSSVSVDLKRDIFNIRDKFSNIFKICSTFLYDVSPEEQDAQITAYDYLLRKWAKHVPEYISKTFSVGFE